MAQQYKLAMDGSAKASMNAYLEYKRIVGDDDGGELFSPKEYEEYKKKVIPMRLQNRVYTSWVSPSNMDCKCVGPETPCFCHHRYKQHKTDFEVIPGKRPILLPCKARRCGCRSYHYVPLNGSQPIRCHCKHTTDDHSEVTPFKCKKQSCGKCSGFRSSFTCGCGQPINDHQTLVETGDEREARGHPVGQATPYAAMGALTGFSSLIDGYLRLDPSGAGTPSEEFLSQRITSRDDPFLRSNLASIQANSMVRRGPGLSAEEKKEVESSLRRPGESELDYFERRYQERQKKVCVSPQPLGELKPESSHSSSTSHQMTRKIAKKPLSGNNKT